MRNIVGRSWRQIAVVALLVTVDLAVSLPIMGATYRPFSWMSIAPADAATLYPVIQSISVENGTSRSALQDAGERVVLAVAVSPGARVTLQRSTNLLDSAAWNDMVSTSVTDHVILLIDTNPVSRAVFYRVLQLLGETP